MRRGDMLTVIEGEYCGATGLFMDVTRDGMIVVEFGGRWRASFHPHAVDLAPVTLWNLLVTPEWLRRLDLVRAKHERVGGPDEQQLADWGRSS